MHNEKERSRISKFLSLVLRHQPQTIDLQLDAQGWASVDELLQKLNAHQKKLDRETLNHLVATNNKKRFAFSEDGTKIRASQGHSIAVDLDYTAATPPPVLFHGTAEKSLAVIRMEGLQKMRRHHVHLSTDKETALNVGKRHGRPVLLAIDAAAMHADGYTFFHSANGVWLTAGVPPRYLQLVSA